MKKILAICVAILALVCAARAAQITVVPPPSVAKGEKFAITVRVTDGNVESQPSAPSIQGCQLLFGPSVSRRSSVQIVNGKRSSSSSVDFTYTYRADKSGTVTFPAVQLQVDGKTVSTKAATFTIAESNAAAATSQRNRPVSVDDITTQSSDRPVGANDVFVRIILNKSTAYEQEAIECTIKLYTKYGIEEFMPTKQPAFDGFLIQEVDLRPTLNQRETYNGQQYMTAVLKKCIIFPQKSGKLTINSGEYDISVVQFDQTNMYYFSVSTPTKRKIKVSSNSASIDIKPLPEPRPEGFSGAVGTFSVESRLVGNRFHTGDPASLIYTVSGTGNIKYIKEPDIDFPTEFEVYTPKSDFKGGVKGANVTGTMTIDYTFVPRSVGEFHIPADRFVYFDPQRARYETLTTPDYTLKVAKGTNDERAEITTKNTDILHIKPSVSPTDETSMVVNSWFYWTLYIVLAIALVVVIWLYGRNLKLAADIEGRKLARADKVARKRLKTARKLLDEGKDEAFYAEILTAVWGFLSDKLSMPASRLSRDNITDELTGYGASPEAINRIIDVLDTAETARYTPDATNDRAARLYEETTSAIGSLEKVRSKR